MLPLLKLLSFYHEYELEDARLAMDRIRANLAGSSRADAARWCDAALAALREAQEAEIGLVVQPDTSAARREEAETRVDAVGRPAFESALTRWLPLFDRPRTKGADEPDLPEDPAVPLARRMSQRVYATRWPLATLPSS